jgi:hypothetical protein
MSCHSSAEKSDFVVIASPIVSALADSPRTHRSDRVSHHADYRQTVSGLTIPGADQRGIARPAKLDSRGTIAAAQV